MRRKISKNPPLQVSRSLSVCWDRGRLAFYDWSSRKKASGSPALLRVLHAFSNPCRPEEAASKSGFSVSQIQDAARRLKRLGFLKEASAAGNWYWGFPAEHFFFGTKDTFGILERPLQNGPSANSRSARPPSFYKTYTDALKVIALEKPALYSSSGAFTEVLLSRKSSRKFASKSLAVSDLSEILHLVWGEHGCVQSPEFGALPHKTSPSGGARHPVEVYPIVSNIKGLKPGIYHYNVHDHALEFLKAGNFSKQLARISAGQQWVEQAPVCFAMTAIFERTAWKYKHSRALRVVLMDCGHLSQTLYLTCAWKGLGCCLTAAFKDTALEALLNVDGVKESVLSLSAAGYPDLPERLDK